MVEIYDIVFSKTIISLCGKVIKEQYIKYKNSIFQYYTIDVDKSILDNKDEYDKLIIR